MQFLILVSRARVAPKLGQLIRLKSKIFAFESGFVGNLWLIPYRF